MADKIHKYNLANIYAIFYESSIRIGCEFKYGDCDMIVGIGIDIIDLDRIGKIYERFGAKFINHILTQKEIAAMPKHPSSYLASRFAVKEAAVKALGTGFSNGITPKSIELSKDALGKPILQLTGNALNRANYLGAHFYHVSLSHERNAAVAIVILED